MDKTVEIKSITEKLEHGLMVCEATDTTLVHLDKENAEKVLELLKEQRTDCKWEFIFYNPNYSPFDGSPDKMYKCTNCGYITGSTTEYCPMCGSKNQS